MVELGTRFIATTRYAGYIGQNQDQMRATLLHLIENGLLLVLTIKDVVQGMIGAFVFDHPVSGERTASETFWWTEPEHRGGGVRLMRAAENWARNAGAKRMQMIAPEERVGKFYEKLGYTQVEITYQRDL